MDTRNPDYPPHDVWDKCQHQWKDIESMFGNDVVCVKCQAPGVRDRDGEVYWPAT